MGTFHDGSLAAQPYIEPLPLPDNIPKVNEVGATSAPLKSAAFFLGAFCKEYNGVYGPIEGLDGSGSLRSLGVERRGFHAL
jgi:hypothetical protein